MCMYSTTVCILFLSKLRWQKNKKRKEFITSVSPSPSKVSCFQFQWQLVFLHSCLLFPRFDRWSVVLLCKTLPETGSTFCGFLPVCLSRASLGIYFDFNQQSVYCQIYCLCSPTTAVNTTLVTFKLSPCRGSPCWKDEKRENPVKYRQHESKIV